MIYIPGKIFNVEFPPIVRDENTSIISSKFRKGKYELLNIISKSDKIYYTFKNLETQKEVYLNFKSTEEADSCLKLLDSLNN